MSNRIDYAVQLLVHRENVYYEYTHTSTRQRYLHVGGRKGAEHERFVEKRPVEGGR